MAYITEKNPTWLTPVNNTVYQDPDLAKIITFFVFKSPCETLSVRRVSLQKNGWNTPWRKPFSLRRQLKQSASNYNLLFTADKIDAVSKALNAADLDIDFPNDTERERICVYDNQHNQFMSVFYHIRNAFAHGRFNIESRADNDWTFILEDVVNAKNADSCAGPTADYRRVTGRMIIRKQTLLNWISLIESGERPYTP